MNGKNSKYSSLNIIIAKTVGYDVLLSGAKRICELLNCQNDPSLPKLITMETEPSIQEIISPISSPSVIIVGIRPDSKIDSILTLCTNIVSIGIHFAIAEQSIGSSTEVISAGNLALFVAKGVTAIFSEYDFIADGAVANLVIRNVQYTKKKTILIGDPAKRLNQLMSEVKIDWNDSENVHMYKPKFTFRLACALTRVPSLSRDLETREKIANELNKRSWFNYNFEDTRKAVGALADIWGLSKKNLYLLPFEAKKRGFPDFTNADELFEFIENLDKEEQSYTSASGNKFNILYVSEI